MHQLLTAFSRAINNSLIKNLMTQSLSFFYRPKYLHFSSRRKKGTLSCLFLRIGSTKEIPNLQRNKVNSKQNRLLIPSLKKLRISQLRENKRRHLCKLVAVPILSHQNLTHHLRRNHHLSQINPQKSLKNQMKKL